MSRTATLVTLMLAASALVPVAAQAQRLGADVDIEAGARGDRGDRGPRQDEGERRERPQFRAQQDRPRPERPQRADSAPQARAFGGGAVEGRGYEPQGGDPRRGWQARGDARAFAGQRPDDRGPGADRPDFRRDDRGPDARPDRGVDRGPDRRADRDDPRYDRGDNRRDDRFRGSDFQARAGFQGNVQRRPDYRGQQYRRYDNNRDYAFGRGGFDDRRAWNRGWRSDNRYAWSDYRTAHRGAYRLPRYYAPSGWGYGYRRFGIGFSLSAVLYDQNYWIEDPYTYRLPEAYGPYRWVRYYNDALLVDLDSGRVVDTVYDIFW